MRSTSFTKNKRQAKRLKCSIEKQIYRWVHHFCFSWFQKAREQWAETLWANLNGNLLQEGIETFLKQLRKLAKDIRQMPVGKVLDNKMKEFRDSLPLFVDLKHEALRDR